MIANRQSIGGKTYPLTLSILNEPPSSSFLSSNITAAGEDPAIAQTLQAGYFLLMQKDDCR